VSLVLASLLAHSFLVFLTNRTQYCVMLFKKDQTLHDNYVLVIKAVKIQLDA
jgi:hypothetical protein